MLCENKIANFKESCQPLTDFSDQSKYTNQQFCYVSFDLIKLNQTNKIVSRCNTWIFPNHYGLTRFSNESDKISFIYFFLIRSQTCVKLNFYWNLGHMNNFVSQRTVQILSYAQFQQF